MLGQPVAIILWGSVGLKLQRLDDSRTFKMAAEGGYDLLTRSAKSGDGRQYRKECSAHS